MIRVRKFQYLLVTCIIVFACTLLWLNLRTGTVCVRSFKRYTSDHEESRQCNFDEDKGRCAYDKMIHRILNPSTKCLHQTMVVGGALYKDTGKIDGDKVLCVHPYFSLRKKNCTVYSFRINNEWSFEEEMQDKFGCEVFAFDPSLNESEHRHSRNIWFFPLGIGAFDGTMTFESAETWNMRTLDTLLRRFNHDQKGIDFLKMDIEGYEFEVLTEMITSGAINKVNHLNVELDLTNFPYWKNVEDILALIEESGLRHFSTINNTIIVGALKVPGFTNRIEHCLFELSWHRR